MTLGLAIGAFVAGLVMFLAPCTLPIVPGYLAFIGGQQRAVFRNALMFVLGFSSLFVLVGASAGLFGFVLGPWRALLVQAGGAVFILFGLTMLGLVRIPFLSGERHVAMPAFLRVGQASSSFLMGGIFALGWSPCIGPILGSILFAASASATALTGATLLFIFSMGIGVPFLLTALMLERAQPFFARIGWVSQLLSMLGGAFLVLMGVLMLMGQTGLLVAWGFEALNFIEYDRLLKYL